MLGTMILFLRLNCTVASRQDLPPVRRAGEIRRLATPLSGRKANFSNEDSDPKSTLQG